MISKEEVKNIAWLARLEVAEGQLEKYQKELSAILDFVGQLSKIDTTGVEPIRQITGLESVFRKDEPRELLTESGQKLIAASPQKENGFVVVPEVFKGK